MWASSSSAVAVAPGLSTTKALPTSPHVGSATTSFADALEYELEQSGRYKSWDVSIETVFIGDDESDCAVRATR